MNGRFAKYIPAGEPVITINVVAVLILGAVVSITERWGFQWDETTLTLAGLVAFGAATWLARQNVFSPATHEREVDEALHETPPQ